MPRLYGKQGAELCQRTCLTRSPLKDMERQKLNVFRMKLCGAEVIPVDAGTATLKDATSEAIRDWITNVETTHYCIGSVCGPHPFPEMVESSRFREQFLSRCEIFNPLSEKKRKDS